MSEKENRKRQRYFDRVTLHGSTLHRLDAWIKQVESVKPGVVLARRDVLNWLVANLPERLSSSQEKALADEFHSELRYLQYAAREIKAAAARGERLTLKELEARGLPSREPRARKPKAPKVGDADEGVANSADVSYSDQSTV